MSKPFAVEVLISNSVTMRTTDGTATVVVDQVSGATMTASGAGKLAKIFGDNTAKVLATSNGNEVALSIPSISMSVVLDPTTGTLALNDAPGRIISNCGDFVVLASNDVNLIGNANVLQTLLEIRNNATLDPANAVYNELSNIDVPDLINSSRLNIVPDATGTTVHSIFTNSGVDNIPHKTLWLMNTGTAVGQTLTLVNQSGLGTIGGLFFGPGDYIIPAGGGVVLLFDTHVTPPNGTWVVYGR